MKNKNDKPRKELNPLLIIIAPIIILIIARNIDFNTLGDLEWGLKKIVYIVILLLTIAVLALIAKQHDEE